MKLRDSTLHLLLGLCLFVVAIGVRLPLVDTFYQYSFEPDSESCVEETRSFYFFFKHPSVENAPHTLTSYPNYSDGQFIAAALIANLVRPLCKAGIIKTNLTDSDNSLFIFSMRYTGVLFDAAALLFTFLMLLLLTGNSFLSFSLCLFYYLFNPQTLNVDFIRVDHYGLFAAAFVMWATLSLFHFPEKKKYYLLTGMSAGLVTATKINFPFYLLLPTFALLISIYKKQITLRHFLLLCVAFFFSVAFMYQRWLMYAENIFSTLVTTLQVGEQWFIFWGNKNGSYYLWGEFYNHGFSLSVLLFLLLFYSSFIYCGIKAFQKKNELLLLLCLTFLLQMLFLMFSPKVARYGMLIPTWAAIFIALGFSFFVERFQRKQMANRLFILLFIPVFSYSAKDYFALVKAAENRAVSIAETRLAPAEWIKKNVNDYSVIGLQYPKVSHPPVFDLPFIFSSEYLQFPFLDRGALLKLEPPTVAEIKNHFNYILLSAKERDYHLFTLQQYHADTLLLQRWKNFYNSLSSSFASKCFTSVYKNYGVTNSCIYLVSDSLFNKGISAIHATCKGADLFWSCQHSIGIDAYNFQIQIAEDTLLRWLVYGSRDGYPSKYRVKNNPQLINSLVPLKINRAFEEGKFDFMLEGASAADRKVEIENFFAGTLFVMKEKNATFQQAMQQKLKTDAKEFFNGIASLYAQDILQMHTADYLRAAQLFIDTNTLNSNLQTENLWQFHLPVELQKGKNYYWRVRFKDRDVALSRWSNTALIIFQ